MLIKCPECDLQVSDKALSCPHCGYPLAPQAKISKQSSSKRKRLPNGFGQISKIGNKNLREPWRAMVTVGTKENGKPEVKLLKPKAYFATYNEAYEALIEYNRNPYDLDDDISVEKLYERWTAEYFPTLASESSARTVTSAWRYCSAVYKMRAKDLRARHIKACMDEGKALIRGEYHTPSYSTKDRIKSLFNLMLDYAYEYEIVDKNYARTFDISDEIKDGIEQARRQHISFKDSEMQKLWENINAPWVDLVLIQCYMGWRPQELGLIETQNVHLEQSYVTGGMKTPAGTGRRVPIHPKIRCFIEKYYEKAVASESKYLFTCTDGKTHKENSKLTYEKYAGRFRNVVTALELNPEHRPHDPRKQFVTMCKKYNVNDYAIKLVVGHRIEDITEAVYTDRPVSWLVEEVSKIEKEKGL